MSVLSADAWVGRRAGGAESQAPLVTLSYSSVCAFFFFALASLKLRWKLPWKLPFDLLNADRPPLAPSTVYFLIRPRALQNVSVLFAYSPAFCGPTKNANRKFKKIQSPKPV